MWGFFVVYWGRREGENGSRTLYGPWQVWGWLGGDVRNGPFAPVTRRMTRGGWVCSGRARTGRRRRAVAGVLSPCQLGGNWSLRDQRCCALRQETCARCHERLVVIGEQVGGHLGRFQN